MSHCKYYYNVYNGSLRWNFIQNGTLDCDSEKVNVHSKLLECKVLDETPCVGKFRTKFWYRSNNNKIEHIVSEKDIENYSVIFLTTIIALLDTQELILFEQCQTHKHLLAALT